MRAVVVGPTYPFRGGIAHYTVELVRTLTSRGHAVSLISFRRQYPAWLYPGRTDRDPSQLVLKVDTQYLLDPLDPLSWVRTARVITSVQPQIAILQWWSPYWAPAFSALGLLLHLRRVPILYMIHNTLPHEAHAGDRLLSRFALGFGTAFITWTSEDRQRLLEMLPRSRVVQVPIPICTLPTNQSIPVSQARQRLGIPPNIPVVLFFGFIRPYKGLRLLLEAAAELKRQGWPVCTVVAGECWEDKSFYARFIDRLGLRDSVIWRDQYIPNEEVGMFFRAADVFVAPYIETSPGAALTLAQRFGLPAIVSSGLIGNLAESSPDLYTLRELDVPSLCEAIHALTNVRPSHQPALVDERCGWETLAREIERLQAAI